MKMGKILKGKICKVEKINGDEQFFAFDIFSCQLSAIIFHYYYQQR